MENKKKARDSAEEEVEAMMEILSNESGIDILLRLRYSYPILSAF